MDEYLNLFVEETSFYNRIVLGTFLPESWWGPLPHWFQGWLRNYIGGVLLYFASGFLWCFYIYYFKRNVYIPKDAIPSNRAMLLQIRVAMKAMPWYCALPSLSEYMIESGWTKCFSKISDVGWLSYLIYVAVYLVIVEFGIYWMHRELHDIKPLYKYLHATHHIYNKQNTLSPFAACLIGHPRQYVATPLVVGGGKVSRGISRGERTLTPDTLIIRKDLDHIAANALISSNKVMIGFLCILIVRFGIPPIGWNTTGSTTRSSAVSVACAFYHTHSSLIYRSHMDCKYS